MERKKDRREYFRERRKRLAEDPAWLAKEAERKARWFAKKQEEKPKRTPLTDEEKRARRREYDRTRRERLAKDPAWIEAEKKRKAESYQRSKGS